MINSKIKISIISIATICAIGIGAYSINSAYEINKEQKIQQAKEREKEQHKNKQIEEAMNKIKGVVTSGIGSLNCVVDYDSISSSDENLTIKVKLDGRKDTTIDGIYKLTGDSIIFSNQDGFNRDLKKYVEEEKIEEVRHTVIADYQDILYGMRGKGSNTWDKVRFSLNDDDYIVQGTLDRFYGGDKAYLVTIDSEWTTVSGDIEWQHICLHMEYGKDNKLIEAKYGNYDEIDPDKDIKNDLKFNIESSTASKDDTLMLNKTNSDSKLTEEDARQLILNEDGNRISEIQKKGTIFHTNGREGSTEEISYSWDIPREEGYYFDIIYEGASSGSYFVGKTSKNVYSIPNQGGMSAYQIKNNKVIRTFKCKDTEESFEWREQ